MTDIPKDVRKRLAETRALVRRNLDPSMAAFPEELKKMAHWVTWRLEPKANDSGEWKFDKVLCIPQLGSVRHASSTDSKTWRALKVAQNVLKADWSQKNRSAYDGLGFVLSDSGATGIDFDDVLLDDGTIAAWAQPILEELRCANAYIEYSVRGRGLHALVLGSFEGVGITKKKFFDGTGFEMYHKGRFFASTGRSWNGAPSQFAAYDAQSLYDRYRRGEVGPEDFRAEQKAKGKGRKPKTAKVKGNGKANGKQEKNSEAYYPAGFLDDYGLIVTGPTADGDATTWEIECGGSHQGYDCRDGRAFVRRHPNGAISAGCLHANSCSWGDGENHWTELRTLHEGWQARLMTNKDGDARAILKNAEIAFTHAPELCGAVGFNEFTFEPIVRRPTPWSKTTGRVWTDTDDSEATVWLQAQGLIATTKIVAEAVQVVAHRNSFHPLKERIAALEWDKTPRLDTWLTVYLGAEDTLYTRAVGKRWLVSLMARLYRPGCKADHVLMLEGPQGKRKSTALAILVGAEYFTDHLSELGSKDCRQEVAGKWLIELGEIENYLHDVRSRNRFKAFVTTTIDHFREPYGHRPVPHPRQCILAATTNSSKTLTDPTGTRRIWPVECGEIQIALLEENVDQLLAEARDCYRNGEKWYLETEELEALAATEQEERYEPGHWDDAIMKWLANPTRRQGTDWIDGDRMPVKRDVEPWDGSETDKATIQDILIHGIGKALDRIEQKDRNTVARCLEHEKWKSHQVRIGSRRTRYYYSPERYKEKRW